MARKRGKLAVADSRQGRECTPPLASPRKLERVMGIEPTLPAWKAGALPLSYTRRICGAVDEARTRDLHLGKVALYQLSYYRMKKGVFLVRTKRLELLRLSAPDPKSGASAIPPRPRLGPKGW